MPGQRIEEIRLKKTENNERALVRSPFDARFSLMPRFKGRESRLAAGKVLRSEKIVKCTRPGS